jgi:hypothetical protein
VQVSRNRDKRIVAIEVLNVSKRTTRKPLDFTNLAVSKSYEPARSVKKDERMTAKKEKLNVLDWLLSEKQPTRSTI